jgi:outer membrane protein
MATLVQAEQELILRVARAYFDVLRSQEALTAFEAEVAAAASVLEQTQQRYEVGLAAITDVNEMQASHDLARVNRLREERTLNQRRLSLEVITGSTHRNLEALRVDFPIVDITPARPEAWVAMAEENSAAIRVAEADFLTRSEEAKAARAALYPTLSMGANYNYNAESATPSASFPISRLKAPRCN